MKIGTNNNREMQNGNKNIIRKNNEKTKKLVKLELCKVQYCSQIDVTNEAINKSNNNLFYKEEIGKSNQHN